LQSMLVMECRLQDQHQRILLETFQCPDIRTINADGERDAGPRRLIIDQHRAGAADALLAAEMRRGQPKFLAQQVREAGAGFHRRLNPLAIDNG
jgi:hypothetical protein